jgi:2'-5' RNA ligase
MACIGEGALVILLPPEVMAAVDVWRLRYDPHVHTIPPHITVAYPFAIKAEEWPVLKSDIRSCLAGFSPFNVQLRATGVFESPDRVLWLRPDDGGPITAINAALAQRFPTVVPPSALGFIPHMTLGFFETAQALLHAREAVERELHPLRFDVIAISYLLQGVDGGWCQCDTVAIG